MNAFKVAALGNLRFISQMHEVSKIVFPPLYTCKYFLYNKLISSVSSLRVQASSASAVNKVKGKHRCSQGRYFSREQNVSQGNVAA